MLRALIIEDSVMVRMVLSSQLKKLHCGVDEANNRIEAIQKFNANNYDIIFLDNHMPDTDDPALAGLLTAKYVRRTNPTIPIVSISSNLSKIKEEYEILGVNHFFGKTIKEQDLVPLLEHLKSNKTHKSEPASEAKRLKTSTQNESDPPMFMTSSFGI